MNSTDVQVVVSGKPLQMFTLHDAGGHASVEEVRIAESAKVKLTVSFRISQELKQQLLDLQATTGMSIADILKAGLDKMQPEAEEIYERP